MENPTQEIATVVRHLTQGTPNQQRRAIETYFTPTAEFTHPFCRVPSFPPLHIPFWGELTSRDLILAIFRWYRVLSPRIDISFDSILLDEKTDTLYLSMHQRFALWLVPFYTANVRLVSVLQLVEETEEIKGPRNGLPSYAEVASSRRPLLSKSKQDPAVTFDADAVAAGAPGETAAPEQKTKYLIAKQEDLYQVNEWIKFLVPFGIGNALVGAYMLFVTVICAVGSFVMWPVIWILTAGGQTGNVAPKEGAEKEKGRFAEGAAWTKKVSPLATAVGLY